MSKSFIFNLFFMYSLSVDAGPGPALIYNHNAKEFLTSVVKCQAGFPAGCSMFQIAAVVLLCCCCFGNNLTENEIRASCSTYCTVLHSHVMLPKKMKQIERIRIAIICCCRSISSILSSVPETLFQFLSAVLGHHQRIHFQGILPREL